MVKPVPTPPSDRFAAADYDPALYQPVERIEPLPGLAAIDDAKFEQFRELGFIAVADVFDAQAVSSMRSALSDLIAGRNPSFGDVQLESTAADRGQTLGEADREAAVRKLMNFCDADPRLARAARDEALLRVVQRLLHGEPPTCFQEMALLKPPHGREKPWHQDNAYFDIAMGEPVVGVWIALDEATVANGCMHVVPGTHRQGPVIHFKRRDWQICDTQVRTQAVVACPLQPGGLLIFDGLLHHGTPTNHTDQRRRALQFHYCREQAVWTEPEERLAVFGAEGKDVTC